MLFRDILEPFYIRQLTETQSQGFRNNWPRHFCFQFFFQSLALSRDFLLPSRIHLLIDTPSLGLCNNIVLRLCHILLY